MDVTGRGRGAAEKPPGETRPLWTARGRGTAGRPPPRARVPQDASPCARDQHAGRGREARPAVQGQHHSPPPGGLLCPGGGGEPSALGAPLPWGLTPVAEQAARSTHPARRTQQERRGRAWGGQRPAAEHTGPRGWASLSQERRGGGRVPPGLGGAEREGVDLLGAAAHPCGPGSALGAEATRGILRVRLAPV